MAYDAGSIVSTISATRDDFNDALDACIARAEKFERKTYRAKLDVDDKGVTSKLDLIGKRLDKINGRKATARLGVTGAAEALTEMERVHSYLGKLDGRRATAQIAVTGVATAAADVAKASTELGRIDGRQVKAHVEVTGTAQATADLTALQAHIARLTGGSIKVDADVGAAQVKLNQLGAQLMRLVSGSHTIQVNADTAAAQAQLNILGAQLMRLVTGTHNVQVRADVAAALAQLAALQAQVNRLGSTRATANVGVSGGGAANAMLAAIVAGLGAIGYAAPAAAAALAAVPAAASGLGQVVGALSLGLSGVGDAYTAMGQQADKAGSTAGNAAGQQQSKANSVANAVAALGQAYKQADRAAITGAQQVAQARQAMADAELSAMRQIGSASRALVDARVSAARQIAQAQRALADAQASAVRSTEAAERSYIRAQEQSRTAVLNLTEARAAAVRQLRDLQDSLRGGALAERRAAISLQEARQALAESSASGLERQKLELDVDEAQFSLDQARQSMSDLNAEGQQWARTGIDGSKGVVAAQRQVTDAVTSEQDAYRNLVETRAAGSKQIADASRALREAEVDGAKQIADAQRSLDEARVDGDRQRRAAAEAYNQAVQQAAWAQEDAAAAVAAAQRQVTQAMQDTGSAGAAGVDKAAQALGKLTPEGRSFVNFLYNEWRPAWKQTSDAVAGDLLPRLEGGMRQLLQLQPTLTSGLRGTAVVLGDLAMQGAAMVTSGPFKRDFATIMASNNRSLESFGQAGLSGVGALTSLGVAASPVVERFARVTEYSAQAFESFILGKQATGELTAYLQGGADVLGRVVDWLKQVGGGAYDLVTSLAPLGGVVLTVTGNVAEFIGNLAQVSPVMTSIVGGAAITAIGLSKLGTAMSGLAFAGGATGVRSLANVLMTVLNPAALVGTATMGKLMVGASNLAQGLGVSSTAANTFGARVATVGSAIPLLGAALIAAGMAWDTFTVNTDEAAAALMKGGDAAQQARTQMADQKTAAENAGAGWFGFGNAIAWFMPTADDANQKVAELRAGMSNLERAQSFATEAQGNYETAVRQFGASSPQAMTAMADLAGRTRDVEIAQIAVREKTDLATAAVIYQRDQLLGSLDADLRKRQAVQQLAQDQKAYADAVAQHGPASSEAAAAGLQLEQTQLRVAEAAKAGKDGMVGYARSVGDMVTKSQGELTPSLNSMVQNLDRAGLSAAGAKIEVDGAGNSVARFPDGKTVVLDANVSPATMGLDGIITKLGAVPAGRTINVGVIDQPAQMALQAIGFTVTTLPNGTVNVTANDQQARATLLAFQWYADAVRTNPAIAANPQLAYDTMAGFINKANSEVGVPGLSSNPAEANRIVRDRLDTYNRSWSTLPIDSNPAEADRKAREAHDRASAPAAFPVDMDTRPASRSWAGLWNMLRNTPIIGPAIAGAQNAGWLSRAEGGIVPGYAAGGPIQARQVIRGYATGGGGSSQIAASDTVPAMLTPGEYVIRKPAVQAIGVPALDAINRMGYALGGPVGLAAGGQPPATSGAAAPAAATAAPVDPAALTGASSATGELTTAMQTLDAAAVVPVTASLQALTTVGLAPYTEQVSTALVPALTTWSTTTTGLVTPALAGMQAQIVGAVNPAMLALTAGVVGSVNPALMAHQGQLLLAQGQQNLTAVTTAGANANISATTAGMYGSTAASNTGVRAQLGATGAQWAGTAGSVAGSNANITGTTNVMAAGSRAAMAATGAAAVGLAQTYAQQAGAINASWGSIREGTAAPGRFVTGVVFRNIAAAWNATATQLALPLINMGIPAFAGGGFPAGGGGVLPGYAPGQDTVPGKLGMFSPGEGVAVPELVRALGGPGRFMALNDYYSGGRPGTILGRGQAVASGGLAGSASQPFPRFAGGGVFGSINPGAGIPTGYVPPGIEDVDALTALFTDQKRYFEQQLGATDASLGGFRQSNFLRGLGNITIPKESDAMAAKAKKAIDALLAMGAGGAGVARWRPAMLQSLAMHGQSAANMPSYERRMMQESGGNPTIVNDWDSNWKAGHPSVGLMQMIRTSWAGNAGPFRGVGPFLYGVSVNPLAHLYSAVGYTLGRYGSLQRGWNRGNGYDQGGWMMPGEGGGNFTKTPEPVFTGDQWRILKGNIGSAPTAVLDSDTAAAAVISSGRPVTDQATAAAVLDYDRLASKIAAAIGPRGGDVIVNPRAEQSERSIGAAARRELDWSLRV